jgi:outer membrane receptor for Fe3+-dicitrate
VPFYSRNTDTVGARYRVGAWTFNLSSTHQSKQYSDTANTVAEAANGGVGLIPGFRLWNAAGVEAARLRHRGRRQQPGRQALLHPQRRRQRRPHGRRPRTAYVQLHAAILSHYGGPLA